MSLLNSIATTPAARAQFSGRQLADALEYYMAVQPSNTREDRCAATYDLGDAGILIIVAEGHLLTICTLDDAYRAYLQGVPTPGGGKVWDRNEKVKPLVRRGRKTTRSPF